MFSSSKILLIVYQIISDKRRYMLEHPAHLLRRKVQSGDNQQEIRLGGAPQRLHATHPLKMDDDIVRSLWRHRVLRNRVAAKKLSFLSCQLSAVSKGDNVRFVLKRRFGLSPKDQALAEADSPKLKAHSELVKFRPARMV